MKKEKKIPLGTKKSPWYFFPQHLEDGKVIEACFMRFSKTGIRKAKTLPRNSVVETMSSY